MLPASVLYGMAVRLRNYLFDQGILKEHTFGCPIICIGNLSVGGTGKTPHTEYLISLLRDKYRTAVLSRGYKRKTRGFLLAGPDSTADQIGDEPWQMHDKYPDVQVAVCAQRVRGIQALLAQANAPQAILLDDAYQHRYVKAGLNILLIDYNQLQGDMHLLPAGRLREPFSEMRRADIVIVTKCPPNMNPIDYRIATNRLSVSANQHLFFSDIRYEHPRKVFRQEVIPIDQLRESSVLLLTGIANPRPMERYLRERCREMRVMAFGDHHRFTRQDIAAINQAYSTMPSDSYVVTTQKDAARLRYADGLDASLREHLLELPIKIHILRGSDLQFNNIILNYVRKNTRNN